MFLDKLNQNFIGAVSNMPYSTHYKKIRQRRSKLQSRNKNLKITNIKENVQNKHYKQSANRKQTLNGEMHTLRSISKNLSAILENISPANCFLNAVTT